MREDADVEGGIEGEGDGAEKFVWGGEGGGRGGAAGERATERDAGLRVEGEVFLVHHTGAEHLVYGAELEKLHFRPAYRLFVRCLPRNVNVGAEYHFAVLRISFCAIREFLWRKGICKSAFARTGRGCGKTGARDEEDGGGAPVEDFVLDGAEAEAGGDGGVEGAEAVEEGGGF